MQICLSCNKNEAIKHPQLGILPCSECRDRQRKPKQLPVEFTSDEIKEDRKAHAEDIIQPFRGGELSKEYVDKWGAGSLQVTEEEVQNAKNVWSGDLTYYKD